MSHLLHAACDLDQAAQRDPYGAWTKYCRRSWLQAAVAITGRYLLGLLPMGGVPFTTADDRQDGGRHGGFQPQRLTGPPVRAH